MKLQGLAILFVILILPLSIIIGEYASFQIETFRLERLYDSRLITATHDALKTYQINTFNDELSDIVNNKLETIEASATTFYNSLKSGFAMQGYTVEDLQQYVPALVYTMYDGYYIYSPYTDVATIGVEDYGDEDETNNVDVLEFTQTGEGMVYGFKPYVYYSCRYQKEESNVVVSDFVINYTLDNYITVHGIVNGEYANKSGYLVTLAGGKDEEGLYREYNETTGIYTFYYSGQKIEPEDTFVDSLVVQEENAEGEMVSTTKEYQYIKINGEKYYYEPEGDTNGNGAKNNRYFFHLVGGERVVQVGEHSDDFYKYMSQMELNRSAINYYRNAYEFTTWVNKNLGELRASGANNNVVTDGIQDTGNGTIFTNANIEYSGSNFNLHRKEVIRHAIESNLSIAIANYNAYSNAGGKVNFQMPKLKETEWEMVENEVSIISFLQGLNIGGKIYNGYTVVTNNKNEEFVDEESIYITTNDGYYNRINDESFEKEEFANKAEHGILDLDFETRRDGQTGEYYIPKLGLASYSSIVGQEKLNTKYDTIYEYLKNTTIEENVKNIYYTALARERWASFKVENPSQVPRILDKMAGVYDYLPITEKEETDNGKGIVTNGLIRYYNGQNVDGKKNTTITTGAQTSKWKDLSGNYDGMISGAITNLEGNVSFDGTDDWVNIGKIPRMKAITLEATLKLNSLPTGDRPYQIISNTQDTGFSLYLNKYGIIYFDIRSRNGNDGAGLKINTGAKLETNKNYSVSATYDGTVAKLYINGYVYAEVAYSGEIYEPNEDTVTAIGVNTRGNEAEYGYADVNIYSVRIYERALTKEEINQNIKNIEESAVDLDSLEIVTNNLIRYYDASNIDGNGNAGNSSTSTWRDLTGNCNAGLWGATANSDGYVSLDGENDWVNIGNITGLEQVTLEASVILKEIPEERSHIISNSNSGGTSLYIASDGKPVFVIKSANNGGEYSVTGSTALNIGQAYNITGVYDGSKAYIYVNGSLANSVTAIAGQIKDPTENTVMAIGCNPIASRSELYFANMNIYTARIYDKALTSDEVRTNYNAEKDKLPKTLTVPSISITTKDIYQDKYMSYVHKPMLSAVLNVNSEGLPLKDVKYVFTTSETVPTEGWRSLSDKISEDGKLAEITLSSEATSTGIWRLYVKATNDKGEGSSYALFQPSVVLDNTPPVINIQQLESNYEISAEETSVNIYAVVTANDGTGAGVATLRAIYTTTSTTPSDEVFENEGQDMLRNNPIGRQNTTEGTYYLHAKVTDLVGNEAVQCVPFTVTKEEVEATCDITIENTDGETEYTAAAAVLPNNILTDNVTKTINVTASKGISKIEYAFISVANGASDINAITNWTTVTGSGFTEKSISVSGRLAYGGSTTRKIYLHIRVTDMDGNVTTKSQAWYAGTPRTNVSG